MYQRRKQSKNDITSTKSRASNVELMKEILNFRFKTKKVKENNVATENQPNEQKDCTLGNIHTDKQVAEIEKRLKNQSEATKEMLEKRGLLDK